MNNININDIQKQRIKIILSLKICEKVLDDFSNIIFMEVIFKLKFLLNETQIIEIIEKL